MYVVNEELEREHYLLLKLSSVLARRFLVDSIATVLFWTAVYSPIFLFTSKSFEAALIGLSSAALLEGILSGPYGKFLDWFRHKLSS
jgi:hypothetical protein